MEDILKGIMSSFGDNELGAISQKLGIDSKQAQQGIQSAVPSILAALAGNSQSKSGEKSLLNALEKDHDGSVLNDLSGFIQNFEGGAGKGILKHAFASRRTSVENQLGEKTGLSSMNVGKLMEVAAPIIMAYLSKNQKQSNSSNTGIASILQGLVGQSSSDSGIDLGNVIGMFMNQNQQTSGGGLLGMLGGLFGKK